tara:strand:- start:1023 stop:1211 length:189 start_codon:yes stop_codon:yes gene_type:complete
MINDQEKEHIKSVVLKALEEFGGLQVNLSSSNAREAIAVRIASDLLNVQLDLPVSPDDVQKN